MKAIFIILLISSNILADSNLTIETRKAVDLLGDVHKATETLNSRVTCSNDLNLKGKEKSSRVVPCDSPLNASDSETGVNTSLYNLNELRRTVREAQARCPTCRPGGSLSGPDFQDELQRRRMNDARRYGRRDRIDWSTVNQIPPRYMHTLIPSYPLNYHDPVIGEDLKKIHDQIREPIPDCNARDEGRFVSAAFLAQASESAAAGEYEEAKKLLNIAKGLADFATSGVIPVVSEIRDAYELFTGRNAFTGEKLSATDRTFAALGMIPFLGGAIKGGKALGKLARFAGKRFPKAFNGLKNTADRATTVASKISKWTPCNPTAASQKANCDLRGVWGHIMKGERGADGLLTKGLHSPSEMFDYIDELPKAVRKKVKIETAENGVRRVKLPDEAWSRGVNNRPRKTLFPDEWEKSGFIEDAINQVLKKNGIDDVSNAPNIPVRSIIERNGISVEVVVEFSNGAISTSYPIFR